MAQAGLLVEQHFGNAKASHGSVLFQGYVNGPVHIHGEPTFRVNCTCNRQHGN